MGFKFVHAADLQLGAPFLGIEPTDPSIAEQLIDASFDAFDNLIDCVIEENAQFLLLSGGLYDGVFMGIKAQLHFYKGLKRLSDMGIPTYIVCGDKDPNMNFWTAFKEWPERVRFFGTRTVDQVLVEMEGEPIATICGISHVHGVEKRNLALHFKGDREENPGLMIGVLHCPKEWESQEDRLIQITKEHLQKADLDYWAIGGDHEHSLSMKNNQWIVYPGTLQGRCPMACERGSKGAVLVEAEGDKVHKVEHKALDAIRYVEIDLDLSSMGDQEAIQQEMLGHVNRLRELNPDRGLVVRTFFSGGQDGDSLFWQRDAYDQLLTELREKCSGKNPFVWWESIHNHYAFGNDSKGVCEHQEFVNSLNQLSDELSEEWMRLDNLLQEYFEPLSNAVDENLAGFLSPDMSREDKVLLLKEAQSCVLGLLQGGGGQ